MPYNSAWPSGSRFLTMIPDMILDALHRIANHSQSLARAEAREVMSEVLAGKCTDAQIAALLIALRMKGETVEEIVGFAEAIRAAAAPLPIERARRATDQARWPSAARAAMLCRRICRQISSWSTPAAPAATPAAPSISPPRPRL